MTIIGKAQGARYTPPGHDAGVTSRSILKTATDVHVTTFPPQTGMEEETHPQHAHVFFVLEGCLTVLQGGAAQGRLCPGDAVHIPAGDAHEIKNEGPCAATFLAVTFPQQPE